VRVAELKPGERRSGDHQAACANASSHVRRAVYRATNQMINGVDAGERAPQGCPIAQITAAAAGTTIGVVTFFESFFDNGPQPGTNGNRHHHFAGSAVLSHWSSEPDLIICPVLLRQLRRALRSTRRTLGTCSSRGSIKAHGIRIAAFPSARGRAP
jgi:hypothetical protein